jgi:hypothetical protein
MLPVALREALLSGPVRSAARRPDALRGPVAWSDGPTRSADCSPARSSALSQARSAARSPARSSAARSPAHSAARSLARSAAHVSL